MYILEEVHKLHNMILMLSMLHVLLASGKLGTTVGSSEACLGGGGRKGVNLKDFLDSRT